MKQVVNLLDFTVLSSYQTAQTIHALGTQDIILPAFYKRFTKFKFMFFFIPSPPPPPPRPHSIEPRGI